MDLTQEDIQKCLSDLMIISRLEVGDTLSSSTMSIVPHSSFSTTLWRRYAGEDRWQSLETITQKICLGLEICSHFDNPEMLCVLGDCLNALIKFKETYSKDPIMVDKISTLYYETDKSLNDLLRHCPNVLDLPEENIDLGVIEESEDSQKNKLEQHSPEPVVETRDGDFRTSEDSLDESITDGESDDSNSSVISVLGDDPEELEYGSHLKKIMVEDSIFYCKSYHDDRTDDFSDYNTSTAILCSPSDFSLDEHPIVILVKLFREWVKKRSYNNHED